MLITDLETMEKIVSSRKDLEWDGWDVLKYQRSDGAFSSVEGVQRNGVWYRCKRFILTETGWDIPTSISRWINA